MAVWQRLRFDGIIQSRSDTLELDFQCVVRYNEGRILWLILLLTTYFHAELFATAKFHGT